MTKTAKAAVDDYRRAKRRWTLRCGVRISDIRQRTDGVDGTVMGDNGHYR